MALTKTQIDQLNAANAKTNKTAEDIKNLAYAKTQGFVPTTTAPKAPTPTSSPTTPKTNTTSSNTITTPNVVKKAQTTPTITAPIAPSKTTDQINANIASQKAAGQTGISKSAIDTKGGYTLKAYDQEGKTIYVKPGEYVQGASLTPPIPKTTDIGGKVNMTDISKTGDNTPTDTSGQTKIYTDSLKDQTQKYQDQQQKNYQTKYDEQTKITDDLQKKLDALDPEKDPNYATSQEILKNQQDAALEASKELKDNLVKRQGYVDNIVGLMTDMQNEVNATKSLTGLSSILNPRAAQQQDAATAKAAILQAGIAAIDGQITTAQSYIDKANTALTADRNARIDYYNSIASLDVMKKAEYSDFIQFQIDTTKAQIDTTQKAYDNIKTAMTDPNTAQEYADAGITLNDSIDQINTKLANYAYKQSVITMDNTMSQSGFKYIKDTTSIDPSTLYALKDEKGNTRYYQLTGGNKDNYLSNANGIFNVKTGTWVANPSYSTATSTDSINTALTYKDGQSTGLQCGEFINKVAGIHVGNSLQDKDTNVDKFGNKGMAGIQAGDVVVQNIGQYGHVALVTGLNEDGTVNVKEANYNNDGKITSRTLSENDIYGYIRPETATALQINKTSSGIPGVSSQDILSATGMSLPVFNYLTQGTSSMTRMSQAQRTQIMNEASDYAKKNGVDVSTLQSQYKAYNDTLQKNISRFNNTQIAENEVKGTADLLITVMNDADFNSINKANVIKATTLSEINDPVVAKYSFHLNQLRNELALFFASSAGKSSADVIDNQDAEKAIIDGLSSKSLQAFRDSLENSTVKMKGVLQQSVTDAQDNIWNLFGVSRTSDQKQDPYQVSDSPTSNDPLGLLN